MILRIQSWSLMIEMFAWIVLFTVITVNVFAEETLNEIDNQTTSVNHRLHAVKKFHLGKNLRGEDFQTVQAKQAPSSPHKHELLDGRTTLTFEGIGEYQNVGDFYANQGIHFGYTAGLTMYQDPGANTLISFYNLPSPITGIWVFGSDDPNNARINVDGGFTSGLSLYYVNVGGDTAITVYSGSDCTGDILARLSLPRTFNNYFPYPFVPSNGVSFDGVAMSIDFSELVDVAFDDITFWNLLPLPRKVLDFEGIGDDKQVGEFYHDQGIHFTDGAIAQVQTNQGGSGPFDLLPSSFTAIHFASDSVMNVDGGFRLGLSFSYFAKGVATSITIYSGLDRTGDILATIQLEGFSPLGQDCTTDSVCPFVQVEANFGGVARSVDFSAVQQAYYFDDVTLFDVLTLPILPPQFNPLVGITMTFEGVPHTQQVKGYYSSQGIHFGDNAFAQIQASAIDGGGDFDKPPSSVTGLFFIPVDGSPRGSVMNVRGGFTSSFSLYYSSPFGASVLRVYSEFDASGDLVATLDLAQVIRQDSDGCMYTFCPFTPVQFSLPDGVVAKSIDFSDPMNVGVFFDDIMIPPVAVTPPPTPAPTAVPAPGVAPTLGVVASSTCPIFIEGNEIPGCSLISGCSPDTTPGSSLAFILADSTGQLIPTCISGDCSSNARVVTLSQVGVCGTTPGVSSLILDDVEHSAQTLTVVCGAPAACSTPVYNQVCLAADDNMCLALAAVCTTSK